MEHSTKISEVSTQEHKQNAKIFNMRNTLSEDIQKVKTEAGLHTDMSGTQEHKKKFSKKEYERLHEKEM